MKSITILPYYTYYSIALSESRNDIPLIQISSTMSAGLSVAGQAFFGSLCLGTGALGVWQTQRYLDKVEKVQKREQTLQQEARPYTGDDLDEWQQYTVTGTFVHKDQVLVGPRGPPSKALPDSPGQSGAGLSSGPQGYFVLTPLLLSSGNFVWINRGWVPRHFVLDNRRKTLPNVGEQWTQPTGSQSLTIVRQDGETPKSMLVAQHELDTKPPRFFWFDLETMQQRYKGPLVASVASSDNTWPAASPASSIGDFKVTPAVHAGYAATWFGLSAAGIYMTRQLMRRVVK